MDLALNPDSVDAMHLATLTSGSSTPVVANAQKIVEVAIDNLRFVQSVRKHCYEVYQISHQELKLLQQGFDRCLSGGLWKATT